MRRTAKALRWMAALVGFFISVKDAQAAGITRATCFTAFDSAYFYLAVVVEKPEIVAKQRDFFADPLGDDAIAVFLQAEDGPVGTQRTARSVHMVVSAAGGAQLYRGANAQPLKGFGDFLTGPDGIPMPFKLGVTRQAPSNRPGEGETGYTVELAIPWVELGGPPATGARMRFNVICYSAAPGSPPLLSLSSLVKTAADVQNPSLWGEIVFVDAPVKTVASAPQAKVCPRVFTARPLIDGQISSNEWHSITAFGFGEAGAGGGSAPIAPSVAEARIPPKVTLHPARPPIIAPRMVPRTWEALPQRSAQPLPRLIFARYRFDYQADPRKAAPLSPVRSENGTSLLATHPMYGYGPWMTYDRVDWHREQLEEMRRSGVDVVLPVYRADVASKQRYAQRGLITLAGALRWMQAARRDYPLVGLYLDTHSLSNSQGRPLDLREPAAQAQLYTAIKEFFQLIPPAFRAAIPLDPKNGGGQAHVVVLSSAAAFADLDASFVDYCRKRHFAEFGADLLILGNADFHPKANLDGYVDTREGRGMRQVSGGWIRSVCLGPGVAEENKAAETTAGSMPIIPRKGGTAYREAWKQALSSGADWVFLDSWNDFTRGIELAPSQEYGVQFADLTRVFTRAFAGTSAMRAAFLGNSLPRAALARTRFTTSVRLINAGTSPWSADMVSLAYRWQPVGAALASAAVSSQNVPATAGSAIPLPGPVIPGQSVTVPFTLPIPDKPGEYTLVVDVAQINKKGEITALFGSAGSAPLHAPVHVVAAEENTLPPYAASLVSTDLPTTLEAGGTYTARVTLRNDGAKTWAKGESARIIARMWCYTSPINSTGEKENFEPVDMADASAPLPNDVPPGQEVTVSVPITFRHADGIPLRAWSQADNWLYMLRWEFSPDASGKEGAVTEPEAIALVEMDLGPQFSMDYTPEQMPGERRIPVKIGIRNLGPQTWRKEATRIGYHWYYLDGLEAVWEDQTTPLPQDVPPGGEVSDILALISAPPYDGIYWLVWDLQVGDTWASTLPSVRPYETLVHRVEVVHGRLKFVQLDKAYNLDGISDALDRSDGDFDGRGRTLPAEIVPPFVLAETVPSTLWMPIKGTGLDSSRKISFRWGPKGAGEKNVLMCAGQKVPLAEPRKAEICRAVHLLAAATKESVTGGFTLVFADGTQQFTSFPVSGWDSGPQLGEEVAFVIPYTHNRSSDQPQGPVALYRYTIPVGERKPLAAIILPNAPDIKIIAITLEKL